MVVTSKVEIERVYERFSPVTGKLHGEFTHEVTLTVAAEVQRVSSGFETGRVEVLSPPGWTWDVLEPAEQERAVEALEGEAQRLVERFTRVRLPVTREAA